MLEGICSAFVYACMTEWFQDIPIERDHDLSALGV
jgi:hypothetical protein